MEMNKEQEYTLKMVRDFIETGKGDPALGASHRPDQTPIGKHVLEIIQDVTVSEF